MRVISVLCLAALLSCSRTEPRIPYGVIKLVYYQEQSRQEERFSFFVLAEDDDGIENLETLSLYHDREGLRWVMTPEDWVVVEDEGKTWIGSRAIAMPGNETLPRGQYRAALVNKGGDSTERTVTFDAPETPRYPFPSFTVANRRYALDSQYPAHFFLCYNQAGNLIQTVWLAAPEGDLRDLNLSSDVKTLALWAEDEEYQTAALTDIQPAL
ncbi:MAG: hypothetical protein LBD24_05100 [Spirochaetaceae bacterium]|jgi:hypothetical protein|nr:hypothetical protein [Spirochaetaceae bacterium]